MNCFKTSIAYSSTLILLAMSNTALADRKIVMMGGGGEPKNIKTTIFDETLNRLDGYLQKNK